jgi:hypothetical protein
VRLKPPDPAQVNFNPAQNKKALDYLIFFRVEFTEIKNKSTPFLILTS